MKSIVFFVPFFMHVNVFTPNDFHVKTEPEEAPPVLFKISLTAYLRVSITLLRECDSEHAAAHEHALPDPRHRACGSRLNKPTALGV